MRVFRLTVIVGILTLFVQCASVPLTGRKQVILLPESEMMQMSLTSYGDFLKENKLSTRTDDTRRVKEVGTRIAAAVEAYLKSQGLEKQIEGYQWEFNLVQSPEMNAWCMPGGKVVVLAQSPQFYKQMMVGVFDRVMEVGPVFRAEKHNTKRHLNEYTGLDFEMGYIDDFTDIMAMETGFLQHMVEILKKEYSFK